MSKLQFDDRICLFIDVQNSSELEWLNNLLSKHHQQIMGNTLTEQIFVKVIDSNEVYSFPQRQTTTELITLFDMMPKTTIDIDGHKLSVSIVKVNKS